MNEKSLPIIDTFFCNPAMCNILMNLQFITFDIFLIFFSYERGIDFIWLHLPLILQARCILSDTLYSSRESDH
jgi:hypothetical protein